MKIMNSYLGVILITGATMFSSCSEEPSEKNKGILAKFHGRDDVEISPGKFITIGNTSKDIDYKPTGFKETVGLIVDSVKNGPEWTHIGVPWNGKLLEWKGEPIPICLREFEGKLYMVVYDRTVPNKSRFRYYKEDKETLIEIKASDFPKKIAIQNMWLTEQWGWGDEGAIDRIQILIDLNPSHKYFRSTGLTSSLWICLSTEKEYYEIDGYNVKITYDEEKKILLEYAQKYEPIKLTQIVKVKQPPPVKKDLKGNPIKTETTPSVGVQRVQPPAPAPADKPAPGKDGKPTD